MEAISVIVPVYKVETYLPKCVDSLLAQTYEDLEIILVDDGSPDGCGAICDEYAAKDPRVKVIHKENGGLSSARNAGMDIARGEYIAFVDSDDWIEPDTYAYLLDLAKKYNVRLACAGRYDVEEKTGKKSLGLCPPREEKISSEELVRRIFLWDNVDSAAWDKLYHRSLLEDIRYPLGVICEDVPTTYRIALKTDFAAMGSRPVYNYLHRSGSITKSGVSEKTFHLTAHTAAVYGDICQNHPALEDAARYLRVRTLSHLLLVLETKGEKSWEKYPAQYAQAKQELKKHLGFLAASPLFSGKEKLTAVLLVTGVYRPLRKLRSGAK